MKNGRPCKNVQQLGQCLRAWYREPLGSRLARIEQAALEQILPDLFGYHLLLVGIGDHDLLAASRILHKIVMTADAPAASEAATGAQTLLFGRPEQLPIASDTVDALILYHSLEFAQDPHQVLREADRVLVPEGHLVLLGFNPRSLWGLWRRLPFRRREVPWCGRFLSIMRLRDWLALLGFELLQLRQLYYRPPVQSAGLAKRLRFLEKLGRGAWPFPGAVYLLVARKKVSTLTPIKPRWRPRRKLVSGLAEPTSRIRQTYGPR